MPHAVSKSRKPKPRVLGAKAFAAITAVEDLRLSAVSRKRLNALKAAGLSTDERRAEVLRAYTGLGRRK